MKGIQAGSCKKQVLKLIRSGYELSSYREKVPTPRRKGTWIQTNRNSDSKSKSIGIQLNNENESALYQNHQI